MSFDYSVVQRNLALELVRVTEAAALAAAKWLGKGDKNAADKAAVDMMRRVLNTTRMDGVIVIGEGERDLTLFFCRVTHFMSVPRRKRRSADVVLRRENRRW